MNKYLILLVCACMSAMFYIQNQKIDQAEKHRLEMVRMLYYDVWAAERNRHFMDRNLKNIDRSFERIDNNFVNCSMAIDKLLKKQVDRNTLYPCVSTGMYLKE
mgnify:CR=1 FL=1